MMFIHRLRIKLLSADRHTFGCLARGWMLLDVELSLVLVVILRGDDDGVTAGGQ